MVLWYCGPFGRDPRTFQPTLIQLGSTLQKPTIKEWIVPERLLRYVYQSIAARIRSQRDKLFVMDPQPNVSLYHVKNFYYVDSGTTGENLAGPFGSGGLALFLPPLFAKLFGTPPELWIYRIPTTDAQLRKIQKSEWSKIPEVSDTPAVSFDLF